MRAITKGREPRSLTKHRANGGNYDDYRNTDELRNALAAEQRGLCCYCMGRIRPNRDAMKIEHWQCQARYRDEQLNYRNLLGACLGGDGQPPCFQHCDTRKADADLRWNPADPEHRIEARVKYRPDGTIESDDHTFNKQLNKVLNLNLEVLKANRKSALKALSWLSKTQQRDVLRRRIECYREKITAGNGDLEPYSQIVVWTLDQKLEQMAQRR